MMQNQLERFFFVEPPESKIIMANDGITNMNQTNVREYLGKRRPHSGKRSKSYDLLPNDLLAFVPNPRIQSATKTYDQRT